MSKLPSSLKKLNLQPEMEEIVDNINLKMHGMKDQDVTNAFIETFSQAINRQIIQKYYLDKRDFKHILDIVDSTKPDDFLVGLFEKMSIKQNTKRKSCY